MEDWTERFYQECEENGWAFDNVTLPPGLELPEIDLKCPKGKSCPICKGKSVYIGTYRGTEGVELVCPEIVLNNPMDKALGVPTWMYRLRLLTTTAAWKRWSLEGCIDAKFYQVVEDKKELDNLSCVANAKFGNNSILLVPSDPTNGGKMALYVKMPFWKAHRAKERATKHGDARRTLRGHIKKARKKL